ncbi:hypothetical protein J2125_004324 [Erwinia toletana]|uniref:Uncharacterized protein n=1 Tax=Winslowiella toletana TaxID=92490 RepID=A0ABS4PES3_9GAMM|nr:hypothetical protein [Winslowiella toletana]
MAGYREYMMVFNDVRHGFGKLKPAFYAINTVNNQSK